MCYRKIFFNACLTTLFLCCCFCLPSVCWLVCFLSLSCQVSVFYQHSAVFTPSGQSFYFLFFFILFCPLFCITLKVSIVDPGLRRVQSMVLKEEKFLIYWNFYCFSCGSGIKLMAGLLAAILLILQFKENTTTDNYQLPWPSDIFSKE